MVNPPSRKKEMYRLSVHGTTVRPAWSPRLIWSTIHRPHPNSERNVSIIFGAQISYEFLLSRFMKPRSCNSQPARPSLWTVWWRWLMMTGAAAGGAPNNHRHRHLSAQGSGGCRGRQRHLRLLAVHDCGRVWTCHQWPVGSLNNISNSRTK